MKRQKKSDRLIIRVMKKGKHWRICDDGGRITHISIFLCKAHCVSRAAWTAKLLWGIDRQPTQLVIHKANGEIQSERMFPRTIVKEDASA